MAPAGKRADKHTLTHRIHGKRTVLVHASIGPPCSSFARQKKGAPDVARSTLERQTWRAVFKVCAKIVDGLPRHDPLSAAKMLMDAWTEADYAREKLHLHACQLKAQNDLLVQLCKPSELDTATVEHGC